MKLSSTSTFALLQLAAASTTHALQGRQLPSEETDKTLMNLCVPGYNDLKQDRRLPCYRGPDIAYECSRGDNVDKPAPLDKQQDCICKSEMWDMFKGCANCFKLHGGQEGVDYNNDAFYETASSSFCDGKPTLAFPDFMSRYDEKATVTTAETTHSDVLGTQTAVSLYFTQTGTTGNLAESSLGPKSTGGSEPTGSSDATGGSGDTGGSQTGGGSEPTGTETGTAGQSTETGAASALQRDTGLFVSVAGVVLAMELLG